MEKRYPYCLRPATEADIEDILALRRLMFEEMGRGDPAEMDAMMTNVRAYLRKAMPAGQFRAWVVEDAAGRVVSNGAIVVRQAPPTVHNVTGREVYVMNVCTYAEHRRRGLARWIMDVILEWARGQGINTITLRASEQGRPLYEALGFRPTNEMRLRLDEPER